jgi:hypothetical protein
MELLGDVGHVKYRFDLFCGSVSVGATEVLGLRQMFHWLINCFRCTLWNFLVTRVW